MLAQFPFVDEGVILPESINVYMIFVSSLLIGNKEISRTVGKKVFLQRKTNLTLKGSHLRGCWQIFLCYVESINSKCWDRA